MKIVIDISEEKWKRVKDGTSCMPIEVLNGTPLPKGHGRLIDADKLKKYYPQDTDWEYPVNTNE